MQSFLSAIRPTLVCLVFFSGIYTLAVYGIAQLAPNHGKGELVQAKGRYYYSNVGQSFTADRYFNSRPSAVGYNEAGAAGSNKGPTNPDYLAEVEARIDTFLLYNPEIRREQIPSDLVTASGSGLDPNISVEAAKIQIPRIAKERKIRPEQLAQLVDRHTQHPFMGIFGPKRVNVLQLNLALDNL